MKQFIPNRELDELGTGVVLIYMKKSGAAGLPRCVDIEGIANSMGLNVVYETFERGALGVCKEKADKGIG